MNMGMVRDVMDIIANGYGSIPTGLDRAIASRVINYFYEKGWMNSQDIAFLVKAAGGEIRVSEKDLAGDEFLYWYDDPATGERVFQSRSKEDMVTKAKVNPNAEVRVVDSGPIELNIAEKRDANTDYNS